MAELPTTLEVSGWGFWMQGFNGKYTKMDDNTYYLPSHTIYGFIGIMTNYLKRVPKAKPLASLDLTQSNLRVPGAYGDKWAFYRCVDINPTSFNTNVNITTPVGLYDNGVVVKPTT